MDIAEIPKFIVLKSLEEIYLAQLYLFLTERVISSRAKD